MPDELGRLLERAPLPDASERRAAVIAIARAQGQPPGAARLPRRSTRAVRTIAGALALLAFSFTPPGRAIAEELGELVGIGEPSTFDQSANEMLPATGPALIVASGEIPGSDQRYELVGYAADDVEGESKAKGPFSCLNLDLPGLERPSQSGFDLYCVNYIPAKPIDAGGFSDDDAMRLGPKARFSVDGETQAEVARVEVSYEDEAGDRVQAPVIFGRLAGEIATRTGVPYEWGRFVAFLPDDGSPGGVAGSVTTLARPWLESIEVRAFDESGQEVGFEQFGKQMAEAISQAAVERRELERVRQQTADRYDKLAEAARRGELKAKVDRADAALVLQLLADSARGELNRPAPDLARERGIRFREINKALRAAGDLG